MAYTAMRNAALSVLVIGASALQTSEVVRASDRGFTVVAGFDRIARHKIVQLNNRGLKARQPRIARGHGAIEIVLENEYVAPNYNQGYLRNKVSFSPTRSMAKILHVSVKMKRLGEDRAERREANMLANIDNIEFGYYRVNEAYDVRFPSIVYLDILRR